MDRKLGQIAYEGAASVTGCDEPWSNANQEKWIGAGKAVAQALCGDALKIAHDAIDFMEQLRGAARPDDGPKQDAIVHAAAFYKFANDQADLMRRLAEVERRLYGEQAALDLDAKQ